MAETSSDFQKVLFSAKELVAEELCLAETVMQNVAANAPHGISERLLHLMRRKGKRIRSTLLCLIAASGTSIDKNRVAHACAGIELVHLASLVHDDIIDSTDVRRGEKTAHKEWGNQVAVLIGDYLLSQAMCAVIDDPDKRTLEILSGAANELIIGEIQELDFSGDFDLTYETYLEIIRKKTAALLEASAKLGALMGGFSEEVIANCGSMGANFGIAFQIIDDLLDYGFGAEHLDKAKFTDLANGLVTLPLLLYFQKSPPGKKSFMRECIANAHEANVPEKIYNELLNAGAFKEAKNWAIHFLDSAASTAQSLPEGPFSQSLAAMFSAMSERDN